MSLIMQKKKKYWTNVLLKQRIIPNFWKLLLSFKATVIHQEQGKKLLCFTIFKKGFFKSSTVILAQQWKQEASPPKDFWLFFPAV